MYETDGWAIWELRNMIRKWGQKKMWKKRPWSTQRFKIAKHNHVLYGLYCKTWSFILLSIFSLKYRVWWTWSLVYFKLEFYRLQQQSEKSSANYEKILTFQTGELQKSSAEKEGGTPYLSALDFLQFSSLKYQVWWTGSF